MKSTRLSCECPKCGRPLVRRTRRADGQPFLSCSGYPDCRFAEDWDQRVNDLHDDLRELQNEVSVLRARLARGEGANSNISGSATSKALREVIMLAHPDRWPDSQELAHEVVSRLNALRSKIDG